MRGKRDLPPLPQPDADHRWAGGCGAVPGVCGPWRRKDDRPGLLRGVWPAPSAWF